MESYRWEKKKTPVFLDYTLNFYGSFITFVLYAAFFPHALLLCTSCLSVSQKVSMNQVEG